MAAAPSSTPSSSTPRILIIGAGARGRAYATALHSSRDALISGVAEPLAYKRADFGSRYIWGPSGSHPSPSNEPSPSQAFPTWQAFIAYETARRERAGKGEEVEPGVDGVFVCTLDHTHVRVVEAVAGLGIAVMCEKPLAQTLGEGLRMWRALMGGRDGEGKGKGKGQRGVFSLGHVLRYSPHNMLLRKLLLEEGVVGEVLAVQHTEPVGWWHFSHSYVRGNWRKTSTTAPALLTKCCHDIDFLLWLLCSPGPHTAASPTVSSTPSASLTSVPAPHLPSTVSSTGALRYFKPSQKPPAAGSATNCLSCAHEPDCNFSARKLYLTAQLEGRGGTGWPVNIVVPDIEECLAAGGPGAAREKLLGALAEDYEVGKTPQGEIDERPWFGRCVYECANDVCDDQTVVVTWDEEVGEEGRVLKGRGGKSATFQMVAFTEAQCERRGRVSGTLGEMEYDSKRIRVFRFGDASEKVYYPEQPGGGHGGGDAGLARQYIRAIDAVKNKGMSVEEAQRVYIGCTVEEAFRSHAMVFAAEEARTQKKVIDWGSWWDANIQV